MTITVTRLQCGSIYPNFSHLKIDKNYITRKLYTLLHFYTVEVVACSSETQLQVSKNRNSIT